MGRQVPLTEMQGMGSLLPDGIYRLRGEEMEAAITSTGKLSYKARSSVVEPTEYAGESFFDNFTIGDDEDPEAEQPHTWKRTFGAKRFTSLLDASQLDRSQNMDDEEIAAAWAGTEYLASLIIKTQAATNKDGSPNEYAGNQRNEAKRYYLIGEKEPEVTSEAPTPPSRPSGAKPAAKPTTRPAAAAAAPAKPAGRPATAAKPAAAVTSNGQTKPAAAAKPAGAKAVSTVECQVCEEDVPVLEFSQHVREAPGHQE